MIKHGRVLPNGNSNIGPEYIFALRMDAIAADFTTAYYWLDYFSTIWILSDEARSLLLI
jgi:hypothetical protein